MSGIGRIRKWDDLNNTTPNEKLRKQKERGGAIIRPYNISSTFSLSYNGAFQLMTTIVSFNIQAAKQAYSLFRRNWSAVFWKNLGLRFLDF